MPVLLRVGRVAEEVIVDGMVVVGAVEEFEAAIEAVNS